MTTPSQEEAKQEASKSQYTLPITSLRLINGVIGEMVYDQQNAQTQFVISQKGEIGTAPFITEKRVRYEPYSAHNPLLIHHVIRFPETAEPFKDTASLMQAVRSFISRYMELPSIMESIAVHYVLLTWVYDQFNELPYLRIRGDFGTGKTRFLSVVGALCYKPIAASGASTVAPLFHILNQIGGTLVLDEADFRFSSEKSDITKILNNGNAKGFPVLRCELKDKKEFKPKAYTVFGPKIIASRGSYADDALESRCITFDTQFKRTRRDIPHSLPANFEEDAMTLRNQLLTWRFKQLLEDIPEHAFIESLSARFNQIYAPLLSLVSDITLKDDIIAFAKKAQDQLRVDRGLQLEADVLTVIKCREEQKRSLTIGAIAKDFADRFQENYERKITPSWVGWVIRKKLQLMTRKSKGAYILAEGQRDFLDTLYEKFDVSE